MMMIEAQKMTPPFNAESLNKYLADGGYILLATYLKSTLYKPKHAGWFSEDSKGAVYVRRGKTRDCIGHVDRPMIGVRFGKMT
jgi:hypothetical protein